MRVVCNTCHVRTEAVVHDAFHLVESLTGANVGRLVNIHVWVRVTATRAVVDDERRADGNCQGYFPVLTRPQAAYGGGKGSGLRTKKTSVIPYCHNRDVKLSMDMKPI